MRKTSVPAVSFVIALIALTSSQVSAWGQAPKEPKTGNSQPKVPKLAPPTLSLVASHEHQLKVKVTGSLLSGAPGGFTVDWMPLDDFVANGNKWYGDISYYRASFAGSNGGVSGAYNYNMKKGQSSVIVIGESLFDDAGATTTQHYKLYYREKYVFRVRADATPTQAESPWSPNLIGGTQPCGSECITKTQGFWKNHFPDDWPQDVLDNGLDLGNVHYTALELLDIFDEPAAGNGLISLAHQLIAAKLNIITFGLPSDPNAAARILDTIAEADALIGDLVVPPVGSGHIDPGDSSALNDELTIYNEKYDCDN